MKKENPPEATKTRQAKRWLPLLLIGGVALVGGIVVGTNSQIDNEASGRYRASNTSNGNSNTSSSELDKQLASVQAQLPNTTLFPVGFKTIAPFALSKNNNEPATEALFNDNWSLLFFGFTNCPDVCPITLNELNGVVNELSQSNEQNIPVPQVVFVTVDPVRDTIEKMTEYVQYFNSDFIGVSGDLGVITSLTSQLGIVASYTASQSDPTQYSVDHTASLLLIDPQRRVRAKFNPPHTVTGVLDDYRKVLPHLSNPS